MVATYSCLGGSCEIIICIIILFTSPDHYPYPLFGRVSNNKGRITILEKKDEGSWTLKKKDEGLVRIVGLATNMHVWFKCMQKKLTLALLAFMKIEILHLVLFPVTFGFVMEIFWRTISFELVFGH
jgi:hypothetical protein